MEDTLYIEFNSNSCKLAIYESMNERFSMVDLSGGYGSIRIPYALQENHWEEEQQVLIGEDAINFDLHENSRYIENVWEHPKDWVIFVSILVKKVKELYQDCRLSKLFCFVHEAKQVDERKEPLETELNMDVIFVNGRQIFDLYVEIHAQIGKKYLGLYLEDGLYLYSKEQKAQQKLFLFAKVFDDYVMSYLRDQVAGKEKLSVIQNHQLKRIFYQQRIYLFRKLFAGKDVSIYSSVTYPPKKITFSAQEFLNFFYEKTSGHELKRWVEDVEIILGADEVEDLIKNIGMGLVTDAYMLLQLLYEYSRKHESISIQQDFYETDIGLVEKNGSFIRIATLEKLEIGEHRFRFLLDECHEVKLVLRRQEAIEICRIIDLPKDPWFRQLFLDINIDENYRLNEVNYELRRI